jgi:hypothetical protein
MKTEKRYQGELGRYFRTMKEEYYEKTSTAFSSIGIMQTFLNRKVGWNMLELL